MTITDLWNLLFMEPMLNGLILLYSLLFQNFGLTIILFTVLVRVATLPLTLRQLQASKGLSALQPKMAELQQRYGKDRQRMSQEQMRLYREGGINPLGCAVPTLIQFPIWIGLYQSILLAMAVTPEGLLDLSQRLYSLPLLHQMVPLQRHFLWLDLSRPDPSSILPVLVGASMWVQQKMMTMPSMDPRQQQMNSMMQWMMPIMFGFFTLQFASGLAVYWVVSTVIGIVIQYYVTGWGSLFPGRAAASVAGPTGVATAAPEAALLERNSASLSGGQGRSRKKKDTDGKSRGKRKDRRRGPREGAGSAERQSL